jgi:sugar/nucleoside kinase (ribokinase family)
MRIDLPIPHDRPFDVVGVGNNVKVVDTTGAGDVFRGAFLYGFLQGWEVGDILRFTNAVSALKCTRPEAVLVFPRWRRFGHSSARARGIPQVERKGA